MREIHARLNATKGTNYSTTVKMLAVMRGKGLVRRNEDVSHHVYRAGAVKTSAGKKLVQNLVVKVYDGAG